MMLKLRIPGEQMAASLKFKLEEINCFITYMNIQKKYVLALSAVFTKFILDCAVTNN